ncbi:1-acyl-sn-glycerol-3-phosphate acyltransferase [bacterium]|nr:1-acyl-sn-glycerol-3-phosphate acyltransferase [bacterium]
MQNIIIAKPYTFIPPRRGNFWPAVLRPIVPWMLRKSYGVETVELRGLERLRASAQAGHGIMLAPNHCRPCDPFIVYRLGQAIGRNVHILASWHLFRQNRLQSFLLPRAGAFSIYREGTDREALKCAVQILVEARRPLVVFPEGVISRHNDRLNHLMEGTALMSRSAAKQRAAAQPAGRVVIHPVAIRYLFEGNVEAAARPMLENIEHRLTWRSQNELPLAERIYKVGSALLALKEIEYFGAPREGDIAARTQGLIHRLLGPLEDEWLKGAHEGDVVTRVKKLRSAILPDLVSGEVAEAERERRWRQLADLYLAQQVALYPAGYFLPAPTPERIIETVERFEEDMTDEVRTLRPFRALVDVGEAIEVSPERTRGGDGDPLMNTVRERLESMLAASLAERREGAVLK